MTTILLSWLGADGTAAVAAAGPRGVHLAAAAEAALVCIYIYIYIIYIYIVYMNAVNIVLPLRGQSWSLDDIINP